MKCKCNKCKRKKEPEDFSFKDKKNGRRAKVCKACNKKYRKKYYHANKEKSIRHSKITTDNLRIRNKQFVWDYLKENPCVDCDESDPIVLEFDHREGEKKIKDISRMVNQSFSLEKIKEEIKKCDVRCANCHRKKTCQRGNFYKDIIK